MKTSDDSFKPEEPRACRLSQKRPNAGEIDQREEDHFRRNYYLPFLDETSSRQKQRFQKGLKNTLFASLLVLTSLNKLCGEEVQPMKEKFCNDLPNPESFEQELKIINTGHVRDIV